MLRPDSKTLPEKFGHQKTGVFLKQRTKIFKIATIK